MTNWSDLPQHVVVCIAKHIDSFEDFIVARGVDRSWRSAAIKENFTGQSTHQVPLLMLPDKEDTTLREFHSLKNGKLYQLNLPDAVEKLCFSSLGWLMTQSQDLKLNLLHPLNQKKVMLPDNLIFENHHHDYHRSSSITCLWDQFTVKKFVLSASPSWTLDYMVIVLYSSDILAFCRPEEDNKWSMIDKSYIRGSYFLDITYYQGQFYAVDCFGNVLVCDIEDPKQANTRVVVSAMPEGLIYPCIQKLYVVELGGTLFVVSRTSKCVGCCHATDEFRVFEVPFRNGNWLDSEVKTLGNKCLFLGTNSSFAVDATKYSGCKANCIYFTSDFNEKTRRDMGVFNMTDGKIEPLLEEETPYSLFPHLWIEPSF